MFPVLLRLLLEGFLKVVISGDESLSSGVIAFRKFSFEVKLLTFATSLCGVRPLSKLLLLRVRDLSIHLPHMCLHGLPSDAHGVDSVIKMS